MDYMICRNGNTSFKICVAHVFSPFASSPYSIFLEYTNFSKIARVMLLETLDILLFFFSEKQKDEAVQKKQLHLFL